jgi:DNA-directed RNA polymerase subunit RPC12/RpoP
MGEVECDICGAVCRVSHEPTMETLKGESVQCPHCATVVVAGTEKRPVELTCASCSGIFVITRKIVKVEIGCPGCQSQLRIRPRPGKRELRCPSCSNSFNVTF